MRSSLLVVELDTGVGRAGVGVDGAGSGETLGVLVEDNVAIILDELRGRNPVRSFENNKKAKETNLALPEDTVDLSPAAWCTLKLDARLLKTLAESVCSLPAVLKEKSQSKAFTCHQR